MITKEQMQEGEQINQILERLPEEQKKQVYIYARALDDARTLAEKKDPA